MYSKQLTAAISDPLTLEAFETREDAIMAGFTAAGLSGGLYVFNGDTNEGGGDEKIEHFGAHLGYSLENDHFKINSQLGYLSSIVDSDTLGEELDLEADYVGLVLRSSIDMTRITMLPTAAQARRPSGGGAAFLRIFLPQIITENCYPSLSSLHRSCESLSA